MKRDLMAGREGFTLIELLIVVVVLGLLASIALVRTGAARQEAQKATVESDLRLVALHQEIFHNLNLRYGDLSELEDYESGPGVEVEVTWVDTDGFALKGTHVASDELACGYFIGTPPGGTDTGPATEAGRLSCN